MKKSRNELIMSIAFLVLLFFCRGVYLYFADNLTLPEILADLRAKLGNLTLITAVVLVSITLLVLIYARLFKK